MRNGLMRAAAILFVLATGAAPALAQGPDPAVQPVERLCDALIDVMKNAKQLGVKGRYEKLKPVVQQNFALGEMTRLSVGPSWNTMSPEDQQKLKVAFERYTLANYASNFNGYDGEKFVVDPASKPRPGGNDRIVSTKLVAKSETHALNYRVREFGGSYKILNVYFEGAIDQLALLRSDFGATVRSGGAAALEKKIDALSDKLMKE